MKGLHVIVSTSFKCKCGIGKTKLFFKRPGFCETVLVNTTCADCGSDFLVKFKRSKGTGEPNKLETVIKVLKTSPILEQIIREEAELHAAPDV